MEAGAIHAAGWNIALALVTGMAVQSLAHHLRLPGIVLLLAAGVALGPDGMGLINPASLGSSINVITGFAVAVIIFEGALNLGFRELRRTQRTLRRLILVGGAITVIGAALTSYLFMGWPLKTSILFGTLVMVTGPTVINPILKRLKVKKSVASLLEAEGVLIDALGAVVATVTLELALSPDAEAPLLWAWHLLLRLFAGFAMGALAGGILTFVLRVRNIVPEGYANVFTLAGVVALFQGCNTVLPESGIAAVAAAGIVMGNWSNPALREVKEFKEELTVLLIGMLFVLLAADVRLSHVASLGWPALWTVTLLIVLIRPLAVAVSTIRSGLSWKEKVFLGWIGPRGIIAAAVASFFAARFSEMGLSEGYELRALVFLVIAATVFLTGLTGGAVARLLGLKRPSENGFVLLGANPLARALAKLLMERGEEVVCIDSNADHCKEAEEDCTRVLYGNGLQATMLLRAEVDTRRGAVSLTANDEVNFLFAQKVRQEARGVKRWVVLKSTSASFSKDMLRREDIRLLFGTEADVELWDRLLREGKVQVQRWTFQKNSEELENTPISRIARNSALAAVHARKEKATPFDDRTICRTGDQVVFLVAAEKAAVLSEQLEKAGWQCDDCSNLPFSTNVCQLENVD